MLGLKLSTDPRWVHLAQNNLPELLTDHAYCEQKAASNAISLIVAYPEHAVLVQTMADIVQEEMAHFKAVHDRILERGWTLGPSRKDDYVNELYAYIKKGAGREETLMERLLFAAMIEARSCERFKMLSETVADAELAQFYHDLMASEARHYTTFLNLARQLCPHYDVEARWQEWLRHEADIMARYSVRERMHG
jgi:tRNA-(ms[2]io[6]A)-hydroxylase